MRGGHRQWLVVRVHLKVRQLALLNEQQDPANRLALIVDHYAFRWYRTRRVGGR